MNMNVKLSGTVLSSLFFEHGNCDNDLEGFLLGKVASEVTDTISDSHLNGTKEETTSYIYSFVACSQPVLWYDAAGKIVAKQLEKILSGGKQQQVVGWFKFRRNTPMILSMRERAVHFNLLDCFPACLPKDFLFLLGTTQPSQNRSTHTTDHTFQAYDGRNFRAVPVSVVNLGDALSSSSDYKLSSSNIVNQRRGRFSQTTAQMRDEFTSRDGAIHSVVSIHSMNSCLHQQLQELCNRVAISEEKLRIAHTEVKKLKDKVRPKPPPRPKPAPAQNTVGTSSGSAASSFSAQPSTSGFRDEPMMEQHVISPTNPFHSDFVTSEFQKLQSDLSSPTYVNLPPVHTTQNTTQHTSGDYPRNKNPFMMEKETLKPPEKDLITLRDSDEEPKETRPKNNKHFPADSSTLSTLMDVDDVPNTERLKPTLQPQSHTVAGGNHGNVTADVDRTKDDTGEPFSFLSDLITHHQDNNSRGSSVPRGSQEEGRTRVERVERSNSCEEQPRRGRARRTVSKATTGTGPATRKKPGVAEAIELSSGDEEYLVSGSPVY